MDPWDFESETELAPEYLVCPPFVLVTALIVLVIDFMRALIRLMGMLFHSSTRALVNWAKAAGGGWRYGTCLSNWSHSCSIGDNSGYMAANRVVLSVNLVILPCCFPLATSSSASMSSSRKWKRLFILFIYLFIYFFF